MDGRSAITGRHRHAAPRRHRRHGRRSGRGRDPGSSRIERAHAGHRRDDQPRPGHRAARPTSTRSACTPRAPRSTAAPRWRSPSSTSAAWDPAPSSSSADAARARRRRPAAASSTGTLELVRRRPGDHERTRATSACAPDALGGVVHRHRRRRERRRPARSTCAPATPVAPPSSLPAGTGGEETPDDHRLIRRRPAAGS